MALSCRWISHSNIRVSCFTNAHISLHHHYQEISVHFQKSCHLWASNATCITKSHLVFAEMSAAAKAICHLGNATDDIQELSKGAERIETLVETLFDFIGPLGMLPLTRSIAREMQDVI